MKKKVFTVLGIVAMLAMVAYASQANNEEAVLSDMAMENAVALAGDINPNCPNGCLTTQGSCKCYGIHPYEEAEWNENDNEPID